MERAASEAIMIRIEAVLERIVRTQETLERRRNRGEVQSSKSKVQTNSQVQRNELPRIGHHSASALGFDSFV
jgi:hypothetical protein